MKTSESITKISPAIVKAMGVMGVAEKDGTNPHFNSKYATLASAVQASRAALSENGLCAMQDQGGVTDHNTIVLTTRILHTSGEWIETVCEAKPKSFTPQDIGSSITYLRRYGLMAALGIPPEDDDGNGGSRGEQQPDIKTPQAKNGKPKNDGTRKIFKSLQDDVYGSAQDVDALTIWAESPSTKEQINQLPLDWQNDIRKIYQDELLAGRAALALTKLENAA